MHPLGKITKLLSVNLEKRNTLVSYFIHYDKDLSIGVVFFYHKVFARL